MSHDSETNGVSGRFSVVTKTDVTYLERYRCVVPSVTMLVNPFEELVPDAPGIGADGRSEKACERITWPGRGSAFGASRPAGTLRSVSCRCGGHCGGSLA